MEGQSRNAGVFGGYPEGSSKNIGVFFGKHLPSPKVFAGEAFGTCYFSWRNEYKVLASEQAKNLMGQNFFRMVFSRLYSYFKGYVRRKTKSRRLLQKLCVFEKLFDYAKRYDEIIRSVLECITVLVLGGKKFHYFVGWGFCCFRSIRFSRLLYANGEKSLSVRTIFQVVQFVICSICLFSSSC